MSVAPPGCALVSIVIVDSSWTLVVLGLQHLESALRVWYLEEAWLEMVLKDVLRTEFEFPSFSSSAFGS
jgi:hypothetical protein